MCGERGVLIHRTVTYESNFIVDYDPGGGDKIKIKPLKTLQTIKHTARCWLPLVKLNVFIIAQRIETIERKEVKIARDCMEKFTIRANLPLNKVLDK